MLICFFKEYKCQDPKSCFKCTMDLCPVNILTFFFFECYMPISFCELLLKLPSVSREVCHIALWNDLRTTCPTLSWVWETTNLNTLLQNIKLLFTK